MSRLERYQSRAQAALNRNADLLYRHTLTFRLGPHEWPLRCSVRDPQRLRPDTLGQLQALAGSRGLVYTDLRVISHHPADTVPIPGATCAWDDGTLEVLEWSQASDFTGTRVGIAVLRRP
ncbi:hypothetical protein SAMN04488058_101297 [Deinococcus reticulitermitis]|uniref:Uncharacterized protein n=1 Tax=Deinococcus reticulitermitis TaxID=856736 RepID=A0A1H6STX0_9DEIO|nr:hypothetical protein [Deinococcus reticulitermitis]SEI67032.1 hypothetical protein SAMN04488058_101297 [Deinococcus reticulitermitis]